MFEGFRHHRIPTDGAEIDLVTGGSGPPLLLLHGFPQTRAAWARVAPLLSSDFTLIIPDLRGYGRSAGPGADPEHIGHSKRAMARDMVEVMDTLGYDSFALAGHDRGGRVAYRLAFDHAERVRALALLDIMTTLDTWEAMDWRAAIAAYHWPLLAQPAPLPERIIGADPVAYLDHLIMRWQGRDAQLDPDAMTDYRNAIKTAEVIEAMVEDYRAGASIDVDIDRADREAGTRLAPALLVLRGAQYAPGSFLPAWQRWTDDVREVVLDCGHFIAEERAEETAAELHRHLL